MPESRPLMALGHNAALIGEPCGGPISEQRAALKAMMDRAGWPEPARLPNGKPVVSEGHCSLSHGGGWIIAAQSPSPIGVDVEAAEDRLERARRRFVGPQDQPVFDVMGENLGTLCRIWTAKEAAFKVFGTGVDFLTGIQWTRVSDDGAHLIAVQQDVELALRWAPLDGPSATTWLALAVVSPGDQA